MASVEVNLIAGLEVTATLSASELNVTISFGETITVDAALSETSTNPVQNQAINTALGLKVTAPKTALSTEPADANYFAIFTTSWLQLTWANVKAWLKSYFDGLYTPLSHTTQATGAHPATAITFTIEELTGEDTIVAADSGKHFYSTAASDYNLTLDSGLTHPISIFQKGNGVVTVIAGSGTPTLLGAVKTGGANTAIAIVPESTTVYEIIGGVA